MKELPGLDTQSLKCIMKEQACPQTTKGRCIGSRKLSIQRLWNSKLRVSRLLRQRLNSTSACYTKTVWACREIIIRPGSTLLLLQELEALKRKRSWMKLVHRSNRSTKHGDCGGSREWAILRCGILMRSALPMMALRF